MLGRIGDIKDGISRLQEAIKTDASKPLYRYVLSSELMTIVKKRGLNAQTKPWAEIAVTHLTFLMDQSARLTENGTPLTYLKNGKKINYLDDVHRQLGFHFMRERRFEEAKGQLKISISLKRDSPKTLAALGKCMYQTNDPNASKVLRKVLKLAPKDAVAALYLGLIELQRNNTTGALKWLQRAGKSGKAEVAEAHYQVALILRDRRKFGAARAAIKRYLKTASSDHPFYQEATSILSDLKG